MGIIWQRGMTLIPPVVCHVLHGLGGNDVRRALTSSTIGGWLARFSVYNGNIVVKIL